MTREIDVVRQFLAERQASADPDAPIEEMRAGYDQAGAAMPMADKVDVEPVSLGGVPGKLFTPDTPNGAALLYFHGGGYMTGSSDSHRALASHLAAACEAPVYAMDYRMAPEAPFPAAVDDGLAAYKALLELKPASQIVISGDSAGGGLTVATALKAKAEGMPQPAGLIPISPWVNLENTGWSYAAKSGSDPMVTLEGLERMAQGYAASTSRTDPLVSPMHADLSGLAPMLIQVGAEEVLLSDSVTLAERAGAAGVPVTLEIWPDMVHVFHYFHAFLSDARTAITQMGAWTKSRTG